MSDWPFCKLKQFAIGIFACIFIRLVEKRTDCRVGLPAVWCRWSSLQVVRGKGADGRRKPGGAVLSSCCVVRTLPRAPFAGVIDAGRRSRPPALPADVSVIAQPTSASAGAARSRRSHGLRGYARESAPTPRRSGP